MKQGEFYWIKPKGGGNWTVGQLIQYSNAVMFVRIGDEDDYAPDRFEIGPKLEPPGA